MKARFLILLVLVAASSINAASESYPRPWENETWVDENPYAHCFFGIMFLDISGSLVADEDKLIESSLNQSIPDFQESLDTIRLGEIHSELAVGGKTNNNIDRAIEAKDNADEIRLGVEDIVPLKYSWDVWSYPGYWGDCIDYSLLALEGYAAEINQKRGEFESWRGKLQYAGVCDEDYAGQSIEYCNMPLEDAKCVASGIWEDVPDFEWYYGCMHEHWETIDSLDSRLNGVMLAYNETVDMCEDGREEAENRKAEADSKFSEIEGEELGSIYRSSYGEGNSGALGVRGTYERLVETKDAADAEYSKAEKADEGDSKWLKDCIVGSGNAISGYELVLQSSILEEADSVVEEYGEGAWERLEEANTIENKMGGLGKDRLATARAECTAGDGAGTLGQRFVHYGKCTKYANMAIESAEEGEGALEAYISAELSWLDGFLSKAEEDFIDTHIERAQEALLEQGMPADFLEVVENIEESILAKAEHKYGYLEEKRAALKADILLGGQQFGYLNSWFEVGEECYSGNVLDYSCALGQLNEMGSLYLEIEGELLAQKDLLVESSLVVDEEERLEIPKLDDPSEAYLYVDITNPTKFSGEDVVVEIPTSFEFRKLDLVSGSDYVRMVTPSRNKIEIYLTTIGPEETIHLQFKKEHVVCRSKSYEEEAFGDSEGGATVSKTLKIDCEQEVGGIILGEGFEADEVYVNGLRAEMEEGCLPSVFAEGAHTIEMESYEIDAYDVERELAFASTLGQTTNIELFFNFEPKKDLEYIAYSSVEEGKDLDDLDVFGYTGEKITEKKTMGESTIFFKVHDLVEGKEAKVRVSYEISDLEDYLNEQILYYSGQNLTEEEEVLLTQAKNYLLADENTGAYQAIEELRGKTEKRKKAEGKVAQKHEKICEKIEEKIAKLSAAVSLAEELGISNNIIREMVSRLSELEDALGTEVESGALVGPLESFDMNWEKRELTKISKELLKLEKDVKEQWSETGMEDEAVGDAIEEVEQKNSQFSGSLDFEDGVRAFYALGLAESALEKLGEEQDSSDAENKALLESELEDGYDLLEEYSREYEEADGTHLEGLFMKKPSEISKSFKEASSSEDYDGAISGITELEEEMEGTMELLKKEAERTGENVEALYSEVKDEMKEADAAFVEASIQNAENYYSNGEYVRAIKSLEDGIRRLQSFERKQEGLLVLAITGLLVLGIIALYLLRDQIPKDLLPKKEEKKYKKLKREPPSP
ncbi:hypothetical protein GF412_01955 [Candidatus Micrarchaeota archaeon]|nr:hypothetical protein [Candidatus Micrarchaeota archaeon]MBD3417726.1 hypothetical protein [Candidatus Micrarchaeota archaeon]